ncbi:RNase LS family HEPN domain-containing protein [Lysinibacillus sphaericus]|uniref:RNase LS family HEPN domain-containing protein n=1 Tax=Lysinibacillus sphaericus TaxID=1421 RepID=UPI0021630E36|nr:RNase LS family HEPN domain-containing protein [Lysinibacillus sphaericus]MCS1382747.1 RNase LS family HEPN domain-containing protein [Lysinibacillus sphaericus]
MANTNSYTRLNIVRERLEDAIMDFFLSRTENCTYEPIVQKNGIRRRLNYTVDNKKQMLDFHFNGDGTTTIDLTPGGASDFKRELAQNLKDSPLCTSEKIRNFKNPYFSFKDIEQEQFEIVINLFLEKEYVREDRINEVNGGKLWALSTVDGEEVKVAYYYKNKIAVIQGKPLRMFTDLYSTFLTLVDVEKIPKIMDQHIEIETEIKKETITSEIKIHLPNAIGKIDTKIEKVLYQALFNLKINIDMFDYSFLAFPALKSLEGHLKHIMYDKGIPLIDKKFNMFKRSESGQFKIQEDYASKFSANELISVNNAYTYYNLNRHSIFHWADIENPLPDRTRTIDRIEEAHGIIISVFKIMDSYYI